MGRRGGCGEVVGEINAEPANDTKGINEQYRKEVYTVN